MTSEKAETKKYLKAVRLINTENHNCTFEIGKIPIRQHIDVNYFFAQTDTSLQRTSHAAPRRQYVITLKGKLKFQVTNGDTFVIEPGIILIANDTQGLGHTWKILEGEEWERIYIPLEEDAEDYFIAD